MRFNGVLYGYVHNLQGDVVALLGFIGATVVQYEYDAWGAPLSVTGELAETLGRLGGVRHAGHAGGGLRGLQALRAAVPLSMN